MNIFVVFDVSENEESVKSELRNNGYYDAWTSEGRNYQLPHNCMWKKNTELINGKEDVERAITTLNAASGGTIKLEKLIVLQATPWTGKATPPI
jgi:hypothetical protein